MRVLDLSDLRNPQEVGAYPSGGDIDRDSVNGCMPAVAARSAAPTPDGERALVSLSDGSTSLEPHPGAVLNLSLDDLPRIVPGSVPSQFTSVPPHIGYPPDAKVEGNAADVQPLLDRGGRLHAIVSEDDFDPALTNLTVEGPGFTAFDARVCEARVGRKLYEGPGQQLRAPLVYAGPGCGPTSLAAATTLAADAPLADVRGAVAFVEAGAGCTAQDRRDHLQHLGAVGIVQGSTFLDTVDAGPDGGYPNIPDITAPTAATRAVQYAPAPNLGGSTYPSSWTRSLSTTTVTLNAGAPSGTPVLIVRALVTPLEVGTNLVFTNGVVKVVSAFAPVGATSVSVVPGQGLIVNRAVGAVTNVTVRPLAVAVAAASNTTPVTLTTAVHGLATGDRVAVTEVGGNDGANGTWTATVQSPTTFSLDGSSGTGEYTGSGYVVFCWPGDPNCAAAPTRTDRSRYQSVADPADRVARGQVAPASRFAVVAGRSYLVGATLEVQRLAGGVFRAGVVWYNSVDAAIGESEIGVLGAVSPVTRFNHQVVAPAGAVKAGLEFEWTGDADGVATAQYLTFGPAGLSAALRDDEGDWGAQRIVDFAADPPEEVGIYHSPTSTRWPPPDNGIYAPRMARMFGRDLAFSAWMSDGLRVLDVSNPLAPREVGSFVPPAVADPSSAAGAGPTNRRGETGMLRRSESWPARPLVAAVDVVRRGERSGIAVVSDVNAGIYVLAFDIALDGYWSVASDGGVFAFGAARFLGSTGGKRLNAPVVGMAPSPSAAGYWLVASDGGIFTFGDAAFAGSTGALKLAKPMVGMAPTPTGKGYWLVAADGGVFAFGDAPFLGSTGAIRLNHPVVGMAASPTGKGYWLVAADGGVFAFGDARFRGSTGALRLNRPVVALAATPTGNGYWMTASDGGVFAFGDAPFLGSTGAIPLNSPMVGAAASPSGRGYRLVAGDGGVFAFGDAEFLGSTGAIRLQSPMVGLAALPH